jgi:hypothetical protein
MRTLVCATQDYADAVEAFQVVLRKVTILFHRPGSQ